MKSFFRADNPIWKFIGNLADFFVLSLLWALCSVPVVTAGAATTALYYVTLKMASNQEGRLWQQFFHGFRRNFRAATLLWIGFLSAGAVLAADLYYGLHYGLRGGSAGALAMLVLALVVTLLYLCLLSFVFALLARVENRPSAIFAMAGGMLLHNFLPVLSGVLVMAGFWLVGVFVFAPLLVVVPGLPAYCNSFLYNRILARYGFSLEDRDGERRGDADQAGEP